MRRRVNPLLLTIALLLASVHAAAQPKTAADAATAKSDHDGVRERRLDHDGVRERPLDQLFDKGNEAYTLKNYVEAERLYGEAWKFKPTYDIAANLALTKLKLQKYREAAELFDYALRNSPPSDSEKAREQIQAHLDEAKQRVTVLRIATNVEACELTLDGTSIAPPSYGYLYISPGSHEILATHDGYERTSQRFATLAGSTWEINLVLSPVHPSAVLIVSGILATAVGLGMGVYFTVQSNSASSDRAAEIVRLGGASPCGDGTPHVSECADISSLSARQITSRGFAITGFAVSGAAAIGTVAYLATRSRPKAAPKESIKTGSASGPLITALGAAPVIGHGRLGVDVTGRF